MSFFIDQAVLGGLTDDKMLQGYDVQHYQPFDPVHKRTEATVKGGDGAVFKVTKGAPQVILALAANGASVKDAMDKAVDDFAARGFRARRRSHGGGGWLAIAGCAAAVRSAARGRERPRSPPHAGWACKLRW